MNNITPNSSNIQTIAQPPPQSLSGASNIEISDVKLTSLGGNKYNAKASLTITLPDGTKQKLNIALKNTTLANDNIDNFKNTIKRRITTLNDPLMTGFALGMSHLNPSSKTAKITYENNKYTALKESGKQHIYSGNTTNVMNHRQMEIESKCLLWYNLNQIKTQQKNDLPQALQSIRNKLDNGNSLNVGDKASINRFYYGNAGWCKYTNNGWCYPQGTDPSKLPRYNGVNQNSADISGQELNDIQDKLSKWNSKLNTVNLGKAFFNQNMPQNQPAEHQQRLQPQQHQAAHQEHIIITPQNQQSMVQSLPQHQQTSSINSVPQYQHNSNPLLTLKSVAYDHNKTSPSDIFRRIEALRQIAKLQNIQENQLADDDKQLLAYLYYLHATQQQVINEKDKLFKKSVLLGNPSAALVLGRRRNGQNKKQEARSFLEAAIANHKYSPQQYKLDEQKLNECKKMLNDIKFQSVVDDDALFKFN